MKPVVELVQRGGPVMFALITLSILLYARAFKLLVALRRAAHATVAAPAWQRRETLREMFEQQRVALGAMIAAAPLLGLLGTVSGMVKTFESLSGRAGDQSMEGLARGISEVLVATESGLAVAIPALLLVYLAHREVERAGREVAS